MKTTESLTNSIPQSIKQRSSKTVFLAGSGRSGTTWLMELLNSNNSYRVMFEPFHSFKVPLLKHWKYIQYIRPNNQDINFLDPANRILRGQIRDSDWIDKYNKTFNSNKILIKDIRANLFLAWLKGSFPEIPLIFMLRHPIAVTSSRVKIGWDPPLGVCLEQQALVDDFLHPFVERINGAETKFEKQVYMWCIENYVPLLQLQRGQAHVVLYEELVNHPEDELVKISSFIGETISIDNELIRKPSRESRWESPIVVGGNMLNSWRENLEEGQLAKAMDILALFGFDKLYDEKPIPKISSDLVMDLFS